MFKWTGKNEYVALCEPESISFGGECVPPFLFDVVTQLLPCDETLYAGSSSRCPTFNDPLCAADPSTVGTATFECVGLEVWGVGPS